MHNSRENCEYVSVRKKTFAGRMALNDSGGLPGGGRNGKTLGAVQKELVGLGSF